MYERLNSKLAYFVSLLRNTFSSVNCVINLLIDIGSFGNAVNKISVHLVYFLQFNFDVPAGLVVGILTP